MNPLVNSSIFFADMLLFVARSAATALTPCTTTALKSLATVVDVQPTTMSGTTMTPAFAFCGAPMNPFADGGLFFGNMLFSLIARVVYGAYSRLLFTTN